MGFIDYVAEYFRGPAGETGEPGPAGSSGPAVEVVYERIAFPDNEAGETTQIYRDAPAGKDVAGVAVLGDKSDFAIFDVSYTNDQNPSGDIQIEYRHNDAGTHPKSTLYLDALFFFKPEGS